MHSNCILDSVANLLVRHTVFVGNVQKSPISSHLRGLDPSFKFCCHGPALIGAKFQTFSAVGALLMELFTSRPHDFLTFHVLNMLHVRVGGTETVHKREMQF